jgi:uncharacterized membrane protein YjgN (DUF898 family)
MEDVRSHYELLRIAPEATQEEIEQAYRRLVDYLAQRIATGKQPPPEEFERLDSAFATLRDPEKRAAYDGQRPAPAVPPDIPFTFAAPPAPDKRNLRFEFRGDGSEYFRIWIVNLLLSILTLGIYSAWAKVRREQYFHRNLVLDGAGFDYHATPLSILKGRLVAVALFGLLTAAQYLSPLLYIALILAGIFVAPWFIVRAFRFRAWNSSYRGLRFAFHGDYGGAFKAYIGYGLLVLVTFGICTPLWIRETRKYLINHLQYGHGAFHCELRAADIFGFVLKAWLVAFVIGAMFGIIATLHKVLAFIGMLGILFVYLGVFPYIQMCLYNYVWSRTALEGNAFSSDMRFKPYFGIVLRNGLLTVLTIGLYWPWAKVNLARYRAACTGLAVAGGLDHFMAAAAEHASAFGDEAADIFDLDIAV